MCTIVSDGALHKNPHQTHSLWALLVVINAHFTPANWKQPLPIPGVTVERKVKIPTGKVALWQVKGRGTTSKSKFGLVGIRKIGADVSSARVWLGSIRLDACVGAAESSVLAQWGLRTSSGAMPQGLPRGPTTCAGSNKRGLEGTPPYLNKNNRCYPIILLSCAAWILVAACVSSWCVYYITTYLELWRQLKEIIFDNLEFGQ